MKKKLYLALFYLGLFGGIYYYASYRNTNSAQHDLQVEVLPDSSSFTLINGDILVRPNWGWWPGSCSVENGRKYGHVGIVTRGATGKTIDEALGKAFVVEALFFDQATREFQFRKENQIREAQAAISFGKRFKGIRYRLRMKLNDDQTEAMIRFLRNQLDGGYNILSIKRQFGSNAEKDSTLHHLKASNWHCATLVWEAYNLVSGVDIDANEGLAVYPADIISSKCFDLPDGRVRF